MAEHLRLSRRALLRRGVQSALLLASGSALLTGCASSGYSSGGAGLPSPLWPADGATEDRGLAQRAPWKPLEKDQFSIPAGVIPRSRWARGEPIPARMTRADRPFTRITVHHDGMSAFTSTSEEDAARRLESIRQAHLGRRPEPFGDIGYHYLIDPAGRVWQGRPTSWQGAHVSRQNPGNLGICMLGNFNQQAPNGAQTAALNRFVAEQMHRYNVSARNVYTHQELMPTACPGRSLQRYMVDARRAGGAIAMA